MASDCNGVTVRRLNPGCQKGPVFYASLPCGLRDPENPGRDGAGGEEARLRLVSSLWDQLLAMESPLWKRCQSSQGAASRIQLVRGLLGRPHLQLGEDRGPAVSFSEGGGKVWAALSGDESDIGIDVAGSAEFKGEYPFHRVFQPEELHHALSLADGDLEEAAALLWSVKEAVVKALGCGFHHVDPRQITVYPSPGGDGGYTFPVCLSARASAHFPRAAGRSLWVRSLPQGRMWLSIALWNRRPSGHE